MRLALVWPVVKKEILSTLRDRRVLAGSLLLPLLMFPLLILGVPLLLGHLQRRAEQTVSVVGVAGEADLPATLIKLLQEKNIELVEVSAPLTAVQQGEYQAALGVPSGFAQQVEQGKQVGLTLYSKQRNPKGELTSGRVRDALSAYRKEVVATRLKAAGLEHILTPFSMTAIDASPQGKSGQNPGWAIPLFIILWMYIGGQATAIGATAEERERGTLEGILTAPIRRAEVTFGKFLAVMAFELAAALLSVMGYIAGSLVLHALLHHGFILVEASMGSALSFFTPYTIVVITLSSVVIAAFLATLLMSICLFAGSFREAQAYLAPLSFVVLIPVFALPYSDLFNFGSGIFLVPILNVLLVINEAVVGTPALAHVLLSLTSMLLFAGLLFIFALRGFQRESVIFRGAARGRARVPSRGRKPPSGQPRSPNRLAAVTEYLLRQPKAISLIMTQFLVILYAFAGWSRDASSEAEGTAFSYHQTHNLIAIVAGLCFTTVFEALPMHILLAMGNPRVAWLFDALNAYQLLWLLGHLNAMRLRPILLNGTKLRVRIGLFAQATVALADIEAVHTPDEALTKGRDYVNMATFLFSFPPNLVLTLQEPVRVRRFDRLDKRARRLGIVVDDARLFEKELSRRIHDTSSGDPPLPSS
jgi:sodium transport system permease protein